jgi:outer membrane protein insertion porin family
MTKDLYSKFIFLLIVLSTTYSCKINKYIKEDESFVGKVDIVFNEEYKDSSVSELKKDLKQIIIQKPNRHYASWFWFSKQEKNTKWRRIKYKALGVEPSIYDKRKTDLTAEKMTFYLQSKGYFDASVFVSNSFDYKLTDITYNVSLKKKYIIQNLIYKCNDVELLSISKQYSNKTYLKKGLPVDQLYFEQEKLRITELLNNKGYATFTSNYVDALSTDSTEFVKLSENIIGVPLELEILEPKNEKHKKYVVGKITVIPDYKPNQKISNDLVIENHDGIEYQINPNSAAIVKPSIINSKIYLRPQNIYLKTDIEKTKRSLLTLGLYKYTNEKMEIVEDSTTPKINYTFQLTPQKLMSFNSAINLNYSAIGSSNNNLNVFGLNFLTGYTHKNLLHGAEQLNTNISSTIDFRYSYELKTDINVTTPKFVDNKVNLIRGYKNIGIIKSAFFDNLKSNGLTQLSFAVNYFDRLQFNSYFSIDLNYNYSLDLNNSRYLINRAGFNMFFPKSQPKFDTILERNPFLKNSFQPQLSLAILFKGISYYRENRTDLNGSNTTFSLTTEQSGAEIFAFNKLISNKDTLRVGELNFAQFVKLESFITKSYYFNKKHGFAGKFGIGIASSFGNSEAVPYLKQLFIGGPNSIRAWRARGLGPGGQREDTLRQANNIFYQTGDFKIETSLEYRFPLIWYFEGAMFLDAGNIWSINNKKAPESQWFNKDFLKQIAIGTGLGLRMDVEWFLLRIDLGIRLRNTYPDENNKYRTLDNIWGINNKLLNWNFALNYPF